MPSKRAVQISDVAKPGKSEPSATSKPVIVTQRPLMRDPMMAAEPKADSEPDTTEQAEAPAAPAETTQPATVSLQPVHQRVIAPPTSDERAAREATEAASQSTETVTTESDETADSTPVVSTTAKQPVTIQDVAPPAPALQIEESFPSNGDAAEAIEVDEEAERKAAIGKLVESQEYFLPVDTLELRRAHRVMLLGLLIIIVLGFSWLDLALDANLIHLNGINALTNFF